MEKFDDSKYEVDGDPEGEGWKVRQQDVNTHPLMEEGPSPIDPGVAEAGFINHQE